MVQIQYNYMDTGIQATTDGLAYAYNKGIAVVIMEPVKGGMLANPPVEVLDIMKSAGYDHTPVDWALQFLWNRPEVSMVLSGMGSQQMVDENCASADRSGITSLSAEEEEVITRIADVYRSKILVPCTACEYCMPCPEGVLIHRILYFQRLYKLWPPERFFSWRYVLDGAASGNKCIECGLCETKCPYNLPIRELIKENMSFYKNIINKHMNLIEER